MSYQLCHIHMKLLADNSHIFAHFSRGALIALLLKATFSRMFVP